MVPAELYAMLTAELESQGFINAHIFVYLLASQLRVDARRHSTSEAYSLWRI